MDSGSKLWREAKEGPWELRKVNGNMPGGKEMGRGRVQCAPGTERH